MIFLPSTHAQVSSDGTLPTNVTESGNVFEINGGATEGSNLFHSFEDFSVPNGFEAFFNNANNISNIFSRVTGGNISNIDGIIRANGSANLFLINPAGILFGSGARLDIGGSFYGSTADSILFPEGEFSATNLQEPILTINAPIGLRFRDNPGEIINQSLEGLAVKPGNNLALIGGNITLEGGKITAESGQGNIELGSVADNNLVGLKEDNSSFRLGYEEVTIFSDITLNQGAKITTSESDINLQGNKITLTDGSQITSQVTREQVGGDITINARELLINKSNIATATLGTGKAGNIHVDVDNSIKIVGNGFEEFQNDFIKRALSLDMPLEINILLNDGIGIVTTTEGKGAAGNINLKAYSLQLEEGSVIASPTFGEGAAGKLTIDIDDSINIIGSGVFNNPFSGSEGAGDVLKINTKNLTISDGGLISTSTFGTGDGSNIIINASEQINLIKRFPNSIVPTGILSNSGLGNGGAGKITINTSRLNLESGGQITSVSGIVTIKNIIDSGGKGGDIEINADESIKISGGNFSNPLLNSAIAASTFTDKNAGNVSLNANQIIISNKATISVGSSEPGNGNAGILEIIADSVRLENGATLSASTNSGEQGNININTGNLLLFQNSSVRTDATNSNGGNITINTDLIFAFPNQNNDILANAGQGNGGNITITAQSVLGIEERNFDSFDEARNNITNDISASSEFGQSGTVTFNLPDNNSIRETNQLSLDVISTETVVADACSADEQKNSLILQGKGGIHPAPNEPLHSEILLGENKNIISGSSQLSNQKPLQHIISQIQPIKTAQGEIYPARGVIVKEDGTVTLTAYATNTESQRIFHKSGDCNDISEHQDSVK